MYKLHKKFLGLRCGMWDDGNSSPEMQSALLESTDSLKLPEKIKLLAPDVRFLSTKSVIMENENKLLKNKV